MLKGIFWTSNPNPLPVKAAKQAEFHSEKDTAGELQAGTNRKNKT